MPVRIGAKIHVIFRLDGQRKDREAVGRYLGKNNHNGLRQFDGRPACGTWGIPREAIKSTTIVPDDTESYAPRTVKETTP